MYQLGFCFQAGLVSGVPKTFAAVNVCETASNSASAAGRSGPKSFP